jgi:hypothetical protein
LWRPCAIVRGGALGGIVDRDYLDRAAVGHQRLRPEVKTTDRTSGGPAIKRQLRYWNSASMAVRLIDR